MIELRPFNSLGHAQHGWLNARHHFSFAEYHDPKRMHWGALRVWNDDEIAAGSGFPPHPHRDMEIVTYILDGALEHRDSLGNGGIIKRGEVQRMSAGTGILHSESNPSNDAGTHLLQIWIEPAQLGTPASYEQQPLPETELRGRWRLVASPDGAEGSTTIGQDAKLWASLLAPGETLGYELAPRRLAYVHVIRGRLAVNGQNLATGDAAKIAAETRLAFQADEETEFLLFDLPPLA